jgi:glycosyltransferase involved in cell wall biosynthesis
VSSISVIVPVRNGERYLREALESVLGGTRAPEEVVVVDDGSTDDGAAVAAAVGGPVRVVRQEALGQAAAVNHGVRESRGELVAFIDADDLWEPRKLELQSARLAADGDLDAVFGCVVEFLSPDQMGDRRPLPRLREGVRPARLRGTMLAHRSLVERVGPCAENLRVGEFVDWYSRAQDLGARDAMLSEVVLRRRLHLGNLGRQEAGSTDYVRVVRDALRRRREASA